VEATQRVRQFFAKIHKLTAHVCGVREQFFTHHSRNRVQKYEEMSRKAFLPPRLEAKHTRRACLAPKEAKNHDSCSLPMNTLLPHRAKRTTRIQRGGSKVRGEVLHHHERHAERRAAQRRQRGARIQPVEQFHLRISPGGGRRDPSASSAALYVVGNWSPLEHPGCL